MHHEPRLGLPMLWFLSMSEFGMSSVAVDLAPILVICVHFENGYTSSN